MALSVICADGRSTTKGKTVFQILKKRKKATGGLLLGATVLFGAMTLSLNSRAAEVKEAVKVPQTAQDHYALADKYKKEATELRGEIQEHNQMLAEYGKGVAKNPKDVGENGYIKKMRLHCEKYIKAAESLLAEDEEFAKFHTLRAKELEGK